MTRLRRIERRLDALEGRLNAPESIFRVEGYWGGADECFAFVERNLPCDGVEFYPFPEGFLVVMKWKSTEGS